jgi:hypothetical protein
MRTRAWALVLVGGLLWGCAGPKFQATWYFGRNQPSDYEVFVAVLNEGPDSQPVHEVILNAKDDVRESGYWLSGPVKPLPAGGVLIRPAAEFKAEQGKGNPFPACRVPISVLVAVGPDKAQPQYVPATMVISPPSSVPRWWETKCKEVVE